MIYQASIKYHWISDCYRNADCYTLTLHSLISELSRRESSVFHSSATLLYPSSHLFLLRLVGSREDGLSPLRLNNILNGLVHFWLSFHESRPSNSRESHSLHSLKRLGNHLDAWEHFETFPFCSVLRAWNFTVRIFQDELPPIVSNINLQS